MCESNLNYIASSGYANISTANSNLNGTGAMGTVLSASSDGTIIHSITIKATGSTSLGMIRLFIGSSGPKFLLTEICVPSNVQTAVENAFELTLPMPIILSAGWSLYASTQNAESFNVIASANTWTNCDCPK